MKTVIFTIVAAIFSLTINAHANDDVVVNNENNNSNNNVSNNVNVNPPREGRSVASSIQETLQEIKVLQEELMKCSQFSFKNLELRHSLVSKYFIAFNLTNDKKYLEDVMFHASAVEKNYTNGKDIQQNMPMALYSLTDSYLYWRDCIKELQGPKAAQEFADAKNLKQLLQ
jgi:hypothetical protein